MIYHLLPKLISETSNEDLQKLIDTVQNLEKRMSNFRYQLQAEIDELKELGKSETNVVNFENSKEDEPNSEDNVEKAGLGKLMMMH